MRDLIALACQQCKRKNYSFTKNKKKNTEKLSLKKYCTHCRTHTKHAEVKI